MQQAAKRLTQIWAIVLLPIALVVAASYYDPLFAIFRIPILGNILTAVSVFTVLLQTIYLPQMISLGLSIWYGYLTIRDRDFHSKKEIVHCALLVLWCILGAALVFLLVWGIGQGEMGKPIA